MHGRDRGRREDESSVNSSRHSRASLHNGRRKDPEIEDHSMSSLSEMDNKGTKKKGRSFGTGQHDIDPSEADYDECGDDDSRKSPKKNKKGIFGLFRKSSGGNAGDELTKEELEAEQQQREQQEQLRRIKAKIRDKSEDESSSDEFVSNKPRREEQKTPFARQKLQSTNERRTRKYDYNSDGSPTNREQRSIPTYGRASSDGPAFNQPSPNARDKNNLHQAYPTIPKAFEKESLSSSVHASSSASGYPAIPREYKKEDPLSGSASMHGYPSTPKGYTKEKLFSRSQGVEETYPNTAKDYGRRKDEKKDPLSSSASLHGYPTTPRRYATDDLSSSLHGVKSSYPVAAKDYRRETFSSSSNQGRSRGASPSKNPTYPSAAKGYERETVRPPETTASSSSSYPSTPQGINRESFGSSPLRSGRNTADRTSSYPESPGKFQKETFPSSRPQSFGSSPLRTGRNTTDRTSSYPKSPGNFQKETFSSSRPQANRNVDDKPSARQRTESSTGGSKPNDNQEQKKKKTASKKSSGKPVFDPFVVLGVAPNASRERVKQAYRSKVRELHPDKTQQHVSGDLYGDKKSNKEDENQTQMFIDVKKAWDLIKEDESREKWRKSLYPDIKDLDSDSKPGLAKATGSSKYTASAASESSSYPSVSREYQKESTASTSYPSVSRSFQRESFDHPTSSSYPSVPKEFSKDTSAGATSYPSVPQQFQKESVKKKDEKDKSKKKKDKKDKKAKK